MLKNKNTKQMIMFLIGGVVIGTFYGGKIRELLKLQ